MQIKASDQPSPVKIAQEFPLNIPTYQRSGPYRDESVAGKVVAEMLISNPSVNSVAVFKDSEGRFYATPLKQDDVADLESASRALRKIYGSDIVPHNVTSLRGDKVEVQFFPPQQPISPGKYY